MFHMNKVLGIVTISQIIAICSYFYAISKLSTDSQIGLGTSLNYALYAGIAVYTAIGLWMTTLLVLMVSKKYSTLHGKLAISAPLVLTIVLWVLIWPH